MTESRSVAWEWGWRGWQRDRRKLWGWWLRSLPWEQKPKLTRLFTQSLCSLLHVDYPAAKSLQSCPTLWDPIRWQPTRLPRPWDSPGKNTRVGCQCLLCDYPEITEKNHMEVGSFLSLKDPLFLCHDFIYCFVFLSRLCYEEWFRFTTKCVEVQRLFSDLLPAHKHSLPPSPTFPSAMWSRGLELDVFEGCYPARCSILWQAPYL